MLRTPDSCLVSWCTLTSNRNPAPHLIQKVTATIPNSPPAGVEPFLRTQTRPACTKLTLKQCRTDIFKLTSWKTNPPPQKKPTHKCFLCLSHRSEEPHYFNVFLGKKYQCHCIKAYRQRDNCASLHIMWSTEAICTLMCAPPPPPRPWIVAS